MRADPVTIHQSEFDIVVIGGGIQGAALAREAALRGLKTLLLERNDFASGTSMRSSRLIHGGVRYLQQGHLALVREALAERERLLRLAPHLVRPLPMLMPFFRDSGGMPRAFVKAGLRIYSWLARGSTMPGPRHYDAKACLQMFPGLRSEGLRGGSVFYDGRTEDLRLTLAVLMGAHEAGATLCNYAELVGCRPDGSLLVRDRAGREGREFAVQARHVLNAAGPAVDTVRRLLGLGSEPLVRLSRGSHLVLPPRDGELSLAGFLPDGRIQFVVPHPGEGTLCGTTDVDTEEDDGPPPEDDVAYLLDALGHLLDPAPVREDVRFAYAGWRALPVGKGPAGGLNREAFTQTEHLERHAGETQVHTVVGGKLTTHRSFAERTIAALLKVTDASPSRELALPGGEGPADMGDPLWWRHGIRASALRVLADREGRELLDPIADDRPGLLMVEALHAVRDLGVVTFSDLVIRRLFHIQGPTADESRLEALHELFVRECRVPGRQQRSFAEDLSALREELAWLTGMGEVAAPALDPRSG